VRPGYEGGQMPIHRRLPKRGFKNIFKKIYAIVNVRDLETFESGSVVDEAALVRAGLIKGKYDGIKLLGHGEISTPLTVKIHGISSSARTKIESAGGTVEVL
jgi:large subunit ribosomal protein L15